MKMDVPKTTFSGLRRVVSTHSGQAARTRRELFKEGRVGRVDKAGKPRARYAYRRSLSTRSLWKGLSLAPHGSGKVAVCGDSEVDMSCAATRGAQEQEGARR